MSSTQPIAIAPEAPGVLEPLGPGDPLGAFRRLARHSTGAPLCSFWIPDDSSDREGTSRADPVVEHLAPRVASGEPLTICDLRQHPVPWHTAHSEPDIQSFVGIPLLTDDGTPFGALCVMDVRPRLWSEAEMTALRDLARLAEREIARVDAATKRRPLENLVRTLGEAVENMQLGVTVTDPQGKIVYTNPAEARMHGYQVAELIGRDARILGPPEHGRLLSEARMREASSWTRETVNVRRDGSRFPVLLWSDIVTGADGEVIGIVTCSEDFTQRKRAEQALRDLALRDPLTRLPNRIHFLDRLTQAIERSRRRMDARFAVLFLDLDRFKAVNDGLGHHVGDELLVRISERLVECLRPGDVVARFGGDEFAVLLEGVGERGEAEDLAEGINAALATPVEIEGHEIGTSASIGIVLSSSRVDHPELLWRSADMAMYRAKAGGGRQHEVFDRAMYEEIRTRLQLETDLRRAVENEELRLFYQPIFSLAEERIVGFEALLRWIHPQLGMIPPAKIIPTAEETGSIHAVGEWVLKEACRQLALWQARTKGLWVSINISAKQLSHPTLSKHLENALRESAVDPALLRLEIAESAMMENADMAGESLNSLKSHGVGIFMDDFGTGYSSLSRLHRLPLDALKIDRSFIGGMERGDGNARLAKIIVKLAHSAGLPVVAEGIATLEHLSLLGEMGCEYGQGFLFSQPLSRHDAGELLRCSRWQLSTTVLA